MISSTTRRFWVSYDMEDTPVLDGGTLDCEIEANGIRLKGNDFTV